MTGPIPFVDVLGQMSEIEDEILAAVTGVLRSGCFVGGDAVESFERAYLDVLRLPAGVGCASGTAALELALRVADVGPGAEVITPAHTFFATAEAILRVGATPVFADIDAASYTVDPDHVASLVTERTAAILPVHLYGTPADIRRLEPVARRAGVPIVEDAAQAHLATLDGVPVGALGDVAAFSFYPSKNLGAIGDAGFVSSIHPAWIDDARVLLDHGRRTKYEHQVVGFNHRLDPLQAAVLQVKLGRLEAWTAHRRRAAARYDDRLRPRGFKVIEPPTAAESAYHLYVVEVSNRDAVRSALDDRQIGSGVHYPIALHRQPALAALGLGGGGLAVTESVASRVLSLPMDGRISNDAIDRVCDVVVAVAEP